LERSRLLRLAGEAAAKALARAFRRRKLLETGVYGTIEELAAAEKINSSYVSRILRLTLLAPDVVEAILNGKHAPKVTLATLMQPFSTDWLRQRSLWGCAYEADREAYTRAKCCRVRPSRIYWGLPCAGH